MRKSSKSKLGEKLLITDYVPYRLSHIAERASLLLSMYYKNLGLTRPQFRIMSYLDSYPGSTPSQLAKATLMDKSRITRAVEGLVKRKLVIKETNPEDLRSDPLTLTQQGNELYIEVSKHAQRIQRRFLNSLDADESEHFERMLIKFTSALNQLEAEWETGEF